MSLFRLIILIICLFPFLLNGAVKFTYDGKGKGSYDVGNQKIPIDIKQGKARGTGDTFSVEDKTYSVGQVWTVFALTNGSDYTVPEWKVESHCGFFEQKCGDHCDSGGTCHVHNVKGGIMNAISMEGENWCHRVGKGHITSYKRYHLEVVSYLALTTYQGSKQGQGSLTPGWTIRNNSMVNATLNALLVNAIPRVHVNLTDLYITEHLGLVPSARLEHLHKPPTVHFNYNLSDCWNNTISYNMTRHAYKSQKSNSFDVYTIMKKLGKALSTIDHERILTKNSIARFSPHQINEFVFFDPCNLQFLGLIKQEDGTYIAIEMVGQNIQDHLCLAIQKDANNPYDLHLYEFRNASKSFVPSSRFIGAISPDFIQSYTLQVSTSAPIIPPSPKHRLLVEGEEEAEQEEEDDGDDGDDGIPGHHNFHVKFDSAIGKDGTFQVTYQSPKITSCKISLSQKAHDTVIFKSEDQTKSYPHHASELPFLSHGTYSCLGVSGTFPIPLRFTHVGKTGTLDAEEQEARAQRVIKKEFYDDPDRKDPSTWRRGVRSVEKSGDLKGLVGFAIFLLVCVSLWAIYHFHWKKKHQTDIRGRHIELRKYDSDDDDE